ncbi:hypothetical protein KY363_04280, partial [Candidatus Woesearchaeota archaeon]|nr:hypothetical protein [Candidatus Woesearchaeota archaeon]
VNKMRRDEYQKGYDEGFRKKRGIFLPKNVLDVADPAAIVGKAAVESMLSGSAGKFGFKTTVLATELPIDRIIQMNETSRTMYHARAAILRRYQLPESGLYVFVSSGKSREGWFGREDENALFVFNDFGAAVQANTAGKLFLNYVGLPGFHDTVSTEFKREHGVRASPCLNQNIMPRETLCDVCDSYFKGLVDGTRASRTR